MLPLVPLDPTPDLPPGIPVRPPEVLPDELAALNRAPIGRLAHYALDLGAADPFGALSFARDLVLAFGLHERIDDTAAAALRAAVRDWVAQAASTRPARG